MRKFDSLTEAKKIELLMSCLNLALKESSGMKKSWKTDIYGIAIQYNPMLKKSDFDLIKNKTVSDIVNILTPVQTPKKAA